MAWSSQTLSTLTSIRKYESEINNLAGNYTIPTLTLTAEAYIKLSEDIEIDDFTALYIDDTTEVLAYDVDNDRYDIATGGECVEIYCTIEDVQHVFPTIAGTGTEIYDTTGKYYINVTGSTGAAWNNTVVQYTWANKIAIAKLRIGSEIKKQLAIRLGWRDDDVTSGEILDYIDNEDAFNDASDCLTLHLIYNDLFATQLTEAYAEKRDFYKQEYEDEMQKALFQLQVVIGSDSYYLYDNYGTRLSV